MSEKHYRCVAEIDVWAETKEDAAYQAMEKFRKSPGLVFTVEPDASNKEEYTSCIDTSMTRKPRPILDTRECDEEDGEQEER